MKFSRPVLSIALTLVATMSISQINTPLPSPIGSVSATVGLTEVSVDYFRPKMKGRMIFGEGSDYLQPFGQLWRTGANGGSKITFSTDVKIAGKDVKADTYMIYSIPNKENWDFMLYSDLTLGGNVAAYDKSNEVIRVSVTPIWSDTNTETMTFNIADISEDNKTANIEMAWANVIVKVPMTVDFHDQVMAEIEKNMNINPANYTTAANYYLTAGVELEKALEYINTYLSMDKNSSQFWNIHTKARILAAMGNDKEAIATAKDSLEKAKNFERGDFGYISRNEALIREIKEGKK